MKYTLLISMLLFNAFCIGQIGGKRMDSIMRMMKDSGLVTWSPNGSGTTSEVKNPIGFTVGKNTVTTIPTISISIKRDTIPVILIVIDTETGATSTMFFFRPLDQAQNDRRIPYWIKGYLVRETQNDYFVQSCYLDENKKPLSKSIIVFDAKNY